ncbi:DUF1800 family protein [Neptunomonas sp.]|uniref:DUF1800 domain-containing protein n=1 Tax=Neptunomonas sp. TaxID=1971898 RepID=UPI00356798BB
MQVFKAFTLLVCLCFASLLWAGSAEDSRHLLYRAGFGPELNFVKYMEPLDRESSVQLLLDQVPVKRNPPACVTEPIPAKSIRKGWNKRERKSFRTARKQCSSQLKVWYVDKLLFTNAVLQAQMTLFWHNHFTSSLRKVKEPQLIYQQHLLLEQNALGNFNELLQAVVQDPAMLLYLDNVNNKKGKPNENLARELLELFTMGEGSYSEQDVKALARSLTGLIVDSESYETVFNIRNHDKRDKLLLGSKGRLGANEAVDIILAQPQTARFITEKIWLNFVSEIDEREIGRLSAVFAEDWDIRKLVKSVLLSQAFWADSGRMIKSPLELVIGSSRMLDTRMVSSDLMVKSVSRMGQDLFDPPNVKGWPFGSEWINTDSLIVRVNFGERLSRGLVNEYMRQQQGYICSTGMPEKLAALPPGRLFQEKTSSVCADRIEDLLIDPVWQLK